MPIVPLPSTRQSATVSLKGQTFSLECLRLMPAVARPGSPLVVFLHEGLGSVSAWRGFPKQLCDALGCEGLVYSRPGYGRSTPHAGAWGADFLHIEATQVLPALLQALRIDAPIALFGHSDGASIALLHASTQPVQWVVSLAAHVMVEPLTLQSIAKARLAFDAGPLHAALGPHHDHAQCAFDAWCAAWQNPLFAQWSMLPELARIACPVLAIQGQADEYGTVAQLEAIQAGVPHAHVLHLAHCAHAPHREQTAQVIEAVKRFCLL